MYLIKELENNIKNILKSLGYDEDVQITPSNRIDLGDYQFNGCMQIAKKNNLNPRDLANKIASSLQENLSSL